MGEPKKIGTSASRAYTAEERIIGTSYDSYRRTALSNWRNDVSRVNHETISAIGRIKPPALGDHKQLYLPNGWDVSIRHRRVGGNVNEYYVSVSKDDDYESPNTYYSQYVNDGSYPGEYSTVRGSKNESWDDIKDWMRYLI